MEHHHDVERPAHPVGAGARHVRQLRRLERRGDGDRVELGPPPPAGLVAGWSFNENRGTTAADVTGNGNTATLAERPLLGRRASTAAASGFNGSNDYLSVANSPSINISGNAMAFSMWVNPLSAGGDQVVFAKFWNATMTSPYYQYGLELRGGNTPSS